MYFHCLGIPIMLASDNKEDEPRRTIDAMPRFLENPEELPLINVGAATKEGYIWLNTQIETEAGPQLTIFALLEYFVTKGKTSFQELFHDGTSIGTSIGTSLLC